MKNLFQESSKTLAEADLYLLASELVLSETIRKSGLTFNEDQAKGQIQKVFKLLKDAAFV